MAKPVNEDLLKERKRCSFDVKELIYLVDGGKENHDEKKKIEQLILENPVFKDVIPDDYLSYKEKYENTVRKAAILAGILKDEISMQHTQDKMGKPVNTYRITNAIIKDVSPFTLHFGMFIPAILGQASSQQMDKWLKRASNLEIIGTYAQTELGHGTFLRGLETTATYDPKTEEFILNSPTLTSYKWWPGGLGHTANYCVVVAQLYTNGKSYGVHPFLVQIRDEETHMPLPRVKVGDIGPKMAFSTANNGFLGFDNFRIPRDAMMMKNAQVLKDGTYVKAAHDKLTYGTMVLVRVMIVNDMAYSLANATTIAVRYSAVRHQSKIKASDPEAQVIDFVTQQHKLFIAIASSHALRVAGLWLWNTYNALMKQMQTGDMDMLPEVHAVACCLKAVATRDAMACIENCRLACGGHGFMKSSNLPLRYSLVNAANTYEGENTVLHLQTARFLVKSWQSASEGKVLSPLVSYLVQKDNNKWQNSYEGIIRGMQDAATGKVKSAVEQFQKHVNKGVSLEEAWNLSSVLMVAASEAHCRAVICNVFYTEIKQTVTTTSKELGEVLLQLVELYLVYWALERLGDLLLYSNISKRDVEHLRHRYEELLALIRPNAVGIVDGFDICDEILGSTLGAYDGRVYERLMEEALKSPLNAEPVNKSFHMHLKPLMKGKL